MTDAAEEQHEEPPRKKIRRGTRSCWECKRRKIRCSFASSADAVCSGCRSRGTACISQEFPDAPALVARTAGVDDRLGRVETLVERLVEELVKDRESGRFGNANQPETPASLPQEHFPRRSGSGIDGTGEGGSARPVFPRLHVPETSRVQDAQRPVVINAQHQELCNTLRAAWPSQRELDSVLNVPVKTSGFLLQKAGCMKPWHSSATARETLQLPPPSSHPLMVAVRLLVLCIYLQGLPPNAVQQLERMNVSCRQISTRAADAAQLVAGHDDVASSVEGIEFLMLQSTFHENAGNLGRAWVAARQAMAVAQIMGVHRSAHGGSSVKVLNPETRRARPEHLWFRLVQMDHYLSMMLGLPPSCTDTTYATPMALTSCTPEERLRRLDCVAAGRILQRNYAEGDGLAETREIDQILQDAASSLPPDWWLPPDFGASMHPNGSQHSQDCAEEEHEMRLYDTMRFMDQLVHYHLLTRLHLPYLLRASADNNTATNSTTHIAHMHSKITAVTASRELLSRFISFRSAHPTGIYCTQATNFLAFIAASALCLAHLEAHAHDNNPNTNTNININSNMNNTFSFLAHSRPADRAQLERALVWVRHSARTHRDATAAQMAPILAHLLRIEEDAARGGRYSHRTTTATTSGTSPPSSFRASPLSSASVPAGQTGASGDGDGGEPVHGSGEVRGDADAGTEPEEEEEGEGGGREGAIDVGRVRDGGRVLRLCIPHYGVIEIERAAASGRRQHQQQQYREDRGYPREGVAETRDVGVGEDGSSAGQGGGGFEVGGYEWEDDWWALQGVDMAFESLIRGVVSPGMAAGEEEQLVGWLG